MAQTLIATGRVKPRSTALHPDRLAQRSVNSSATRVANKAIAQRGTPSRAAGSVYPLSEWQSD